MLSELSEETALKILGKNKLARLGCVLESGEPYIVPINYFLESDAIYCHSFEGLKISALRANPKACVEVDEIENLLEWKSVVAFGEFEEITDIAERRRIIKIFLDRFTKLTPAEAVRREAMQPGEVIQFRIDIRRVTGRAES